MFWMFISTAKEDVASLSPCFFYEGVRMSEEQVRGILPGEVGKKEWSRRDVINFLKSQGPLMSEEDRERRFRVSEQAIKNQARYTESLVDRQTIKLFGPIVSKRDAKVERYMYGEDVDVVVGEEFLEELDGIQGDVKILINSPGGNVIETSVVRTGIQSRIKAGDRVEVFCLGMMGSAASYLSLDADKFVISDSASFMVHKANMFVFVAGNYGDEELYKKAQGLTSLGKWLTSYNETILGFYKKRTGKSDEELRKMMDAETFFVGQEAVDAGFFDELYTIEDEDEEVTVGNQGDDSVGHAVTLDDVLAIRNSNAVVLF